MGESVEATAFRRYRVISLYYIIFTYLDYRYKTCKDDIDDGYSYDVNTGPCVLFCFNIRVLIKPNILA